ncbi:UDP-forming cellulose synthase catalytic subunit [Citreimonas salinaria]|uniref:Cellulose synthase catalytic subunit [UDP-forming] n=1 Tax=Citreimonas salinaria TaxID=321339 RepID=A0A1H3MQ75_9RHOB|nr:UDP-forming cellulose synthase catalytic subunit [Citreimonas salinaria]SDY78817.1 cellulose synthase (UDP-forming) [Citreimonas salinaria]
MTAPTRGMISTVTKAAFALLGLVLIVPITLLVITPSSDLVQGLLGFSAVLLVIALKPFASHLVPRLALLAIAGVIVTRYLSWRILYTLPAPDQPVAYAAAVVLLGIETFSVLVFFMTSLVNIDYVTRRQPGKIRMGQLPRVDVLVPSYNEPTEMLAITLAAAKNMYYPKDKLRVVLCDDGGTDQKINAPDPAKAEAARTRREDLTRLCRDLGVMYSTRARNEHAKAGNMTAALSRLNGDLVAIFDADHVPTRDFLARTVGYFVERPKLFLLQTPHFFLNPDPIERNLQLSPKCPTENEMFYGAIHKGLDSMRGAFFCGSAALLRRRALDEAGGFSGETITEDAETALDIHAKGWESLYLDRAMVAGLQPETFSSFIQQRGRWATGMIQMLLLKNPLFRRGLGLTQRLCYLNSMSFWLFPIVRLAYLIIPLFYLVFGLEIFVTTRTEALVYMVSYLMVAFLVQNTLFSRHRWPLISEIYEIAQAPYLAKQIVKTVMRPRAAKFNVTAKDEQLDNDFVSEIYPPLLTLTAITGAGVALAAARWLAFPGDRPIVEIVGAWALFNFLLCVLALRATCERQQRRAMPRVALNRPCTVQMVDANDQVIEVPAVIEDGSTQGLRIAFRAQALSDGELVALHCLQTDMFLAVRPQIPEADMLEAEIIVRVTNPYPSSTGFAFGVRVEADQPVAMYSCLAHVVYGDSEVWRRMREDERAERGLVHGILYVLSMAVASIPRTAGDFLREPARRRALAAAETESAQILAFATERPAPSKEHTNEHAKAALAGGLVASFPRQAAPWQDFIQEERG